jgi:MFS family permease
MTLGSAFTMRLTLRGQYLPFLFLFGCTSTKRKLADRMCSELPSNLVLKKISPKIWLPLLTVAWGIITMCLGFIQNYAGFMAVRALLGIAEGGLLPGIVSIYHARLRSKHQPNISRGGSIFVRNVYARRDGS